MLYTELKLERQCGPAASTIINSIDLLKVLRLAGKAYACGSSKAKNRERIDLPQFGNQAAFVIFGVIQFYKATDAEQVCGTHGIRFAVPSVQQNIKGFDIQFRTQPDEFVIGGCNAADPLLASAFFKRKMNASQFGGLLECNGSRYLKRALVMQLLY